jgi:anti-sigma regulatory factor (Ser/Thr protein kinase)
MSGGGTVSGCLPDCRSAGASDHVPGAGTGIHTWQHVSTLELTALPTAPGCARLHTRGVLWEWKRDHLADDAELVVSEIVTNGVKASWSRKGAGLITLRLLADRHRLIIEVWDHSPDDPRPCPPDLVSDSGRGFSVIEALSYRWGFQRVSATLKVVWAELRDGADG